MMCTIEMPRWALSLLILKHTHAGYLGTSCLLASQNNLITETGFTFGFPRLFLKTTNGHGAVQSRQCCHVIRWPDLMISVYADALLPTNILHAGVYISCCWQLEIFENASHRKFLFPTPRGNPNQSPDTAVALSFFELVKSSQQHCHLLGETNSI